MHDPADKIRDLCAKVLDCKDSEEFNKASNELREAVHDHRQGLRKQVADRAKRKSVSFNGLTLPMSPCALPVGLLCWAVCTRLKSGSRKRLQMNQSDGLPHSRPWRKVAQEVADETDPSKLQKLSKDVITA